jgi:LmbE family N-acetylglucosaminyl deacetylase
MKILAIGAHPDDIELGCFGTLAKLSTEGHTIHLLIMTLGEAGMDNSGAWDKRMIEAEASAKLISGKIHFGNLEDTKISDGIITISIIEKYMNGINPDIIFINHPLDTHQDHRNLAQAVISATRFGPDKVYYYESPSTSKTFNPTIYYDVTEDFNKKVEAVKLHKSQGKKSYMADRAVKGLAEYRAYEIGLNDKLVEGFEPMRIINR